MTNAPFYVAKNGVWLAYGFDPIDPTPNLSTVYPSPQNYPAWNLFPGTGA